MYCRNLFSVTKVAFIIMGLFFVVEGLSPCTNVGAAPTEGTHLHDLPLQLEEVQEVLDKAQESYAQLQDYTAVIHKEEHKNGKQEKDEHTIIKFQKPFKVYLKWLSGKNKGSQLLYVEGKYDNKIIIRKGGGFLKVFGTMEMDPNGFWLRKFTKHSIKEVGFGGIIEKSYQQLKHAREQNLVAAAQCTMSEVEGRPAHKVVMVLAPEGEDNGYYCKSTIQYFDAETYLPLKATFWLWEDETAEVFTFTKVKLNVGLTETDFDRDNKEYHF